MSLSAEVVLFYVTHPSEEHANRVVQQLLSEKLIACANTFPMKSDYSWEGKMCHDNEMVTILKTAQRLQATVEKRIQSLHEYDVPCILSNVYTCNAKYGEWIHEQVQAQ